MDNVGLFDLDNLREHKRTDIQNRLMWALLGDIAKQVEWPCNGRLQKLSAEDWKDILSAGLVKEQRIAEGVSGGFVMLGLRTSRMSKQQMAELIEFIHFFAADKGVKISAPQQYEEWSQAYRGR